ncbi:MAG: hypothetical protein V4760_06290 [Bdellovibrionota bacterium]
MKKLAVLTTLCSLVTSMASAQVQLTADPKVAGEVAKVLKGVSFYGTTFLADVHCNTSTIENPDQLEVFQVKGKEMTVVLCKGTLDGEENVITLFTKARAPAITKLRPPSSSARVTDAQITELIAKAEAAPQPEPIETADVHKIAAAEFETCLRASKRQHPGYYVGETFSKASMNRGMFESMTMYACVSGNEVYFSPENRVQMVYAAAKISYLNEACQKKKTIDMPDVVPKAQASYVMVVKCSLLNGLLNSPAK